MAPGNVSARTGWVMGGREHRILLVEDDEDIAGAMTDLLEGEGYPVTHVSGGEEALRTLHEGLSPCLIVLDLFMPGMSGIEFRRIQQRDPSISQVPVIVVSGVANMGKEMKEMQSMDVVRCFTKPVDVPALLGAVTELCPAA